MDRLGGMQAFVKAAETGSFAAAGAALGLSAQAVGKQLAALESRLGGRLITRTTRSQSLTELGQAYYERCKHVLAEAESADALAQDFVATPRGHLRISAPVMLGTYRIMPIVKRYLEKHPDVTVDVVLTDRYVDIAGEGIEIAIRIGELEDTSLVARKLPTFRLIACAAPSYLAARGRPAVPADLAGHECLGYAFWAKPPSREWTFARGSESVSVRIASRLQVNSGDALVVAALNGAGIILLPEDLLGAHQAGDKLERVLPGYDGPARPLHILYPPGKRVTPKVRAFIDLVVASFGA